MAQIPIKWICFAENQTHIENVFFLFLFPCDIFFCSVLFMVMRFPYSEFNARGFRFGIDIGAS